MATDSRRQAGRGPEMKFLSCERKKSYSYKLARKIARSIRRSGDDVVLAYPCHLCGGWHVGSDTVKRIKKSQIRFAKKRRGREQPIGG
jgi:hypothetical protein